MNENVKKQHKTAEIAKFTAKRFGNEKNNSKNGIFQNFSPGNFSVLCDLGG